MAISYYVKPSTKQIFAEMRIRKNALAGLEYLGIELDDERNTFGHSNTPVKLSSDSSRVLVYMIPTNEELVIAKDTEAIVKAL